MASCLCGGHVATPRRHSICLSGQAGHLACGAQQKCTFCLVKDRRRSSASTSGIWRTWRPWSTTRIRLALPRLFKVEPQLIAYDMHPDYLSSHVAHDFPAPSAFRIVVQHHHAHIVSAMVEHGIANRSSEWRTTAPGTASTVRSGGGDTGCDLGEVRARRSLAVRADDWRRSGDPQALPDGGGLHLVALFGSEAEFQAFLSKIPLANGSCFAASSMAS